METITGEFFFGKLKRRAPESNKGDYGVLSAVCGSKFFRGAASLSAMGALRTGCGIVRVCSTEKVIASVSARLDECIYLPLVENENGGISSLSVSDILGAKCTAFLIGCGMTVSKGTEEIVKKVISESTVPVVFDADALNSISGDPSILKGSKCDIIITPHIGEMSRLTKKSIDEIKREPEKTAYDFAEEYGVTVVLKDHRTVVVSKDGSVSRNANGNPGLARGGSGDVLSGMIASFAAQGYDPYDSARMGVWLHAEAADLCASERSLSGMLPSDLSEYICRIFSENGR